MLHKPHLTTHRELPYIRRPRTQSERRHFPTRDDIPEELTSHQASHLVRSKRKPFSLPDEWDDKPVSLWSDSHFLRVWKQVRDKFRPLS